MQLVHKREIGQRYRLEDRLGEGAHATVYRAFDAVRQGFIALKLFREEALDAQIAEAASHFEVAEGAPILPLLEVHPDFVEGEVTVMPLMQGTLADADIIFASKAIFYVRRLLTALEFCHFHGVVHGDVKPSNLFLTQNGALRLGDFGVRDFLPDGQRGHTLEYAAPELLAGEPRNEQTDLWAAAAALYQLLCGELPFGSRAEESEEDIAVRINSGAFPPPDHLRPYLPLRFRRYFERCFEVEPTARAFDSAAAMRGGLADLVIRAEWVPYRRDGLEIFYEGHELSADGHRTGVRFEASIKHRPRKNKYEAVIARSSSGGTPRRLTGIQPFVGSKAQARQKLKYWMRALTDNGGIS
jgi:serine/threonine protein kinase